MKPPPSADDVLRFLRRVRELPCGCWEWTGARSRGSGNSAWYGSFWYQGGTVRAHRFAHDEIGGKTCPLGWHRDHTCECSDHAVSLYVCPDHLEAVPHAVNEERRQARSLLRRGAGATLCEGAAS